METLKNLLEFIDNDNSPEEKMLQDKKTFKSIGLDSYSVYKKNDMDLIKIVFKSCKYNHSPDYISSNDGTERESDKKLDEGEKELTHMLCKKGDNELEIILEERRSGASIGSIVKYFNHFLEKILENNEEEVKYCVSYSRVPVDNVHEAIDKLARICSTDIYTHKKLLTSDALDIMKRTDSAMRDEIVISCKVKKAESLGKRTVKEIYNSIMSEGEKTSRVRIRGTDLNDVAVTIDSYFTKKIESVKVALNDQKGIVDSAALFIKMEEILCGTE